MSIKSLYRAIVRAVRACRPKKRNMKIAAVNADDDSADLMDTRLDVKEVKEASVGDVTSKASLPHSLPEDECDGTEDVVAIVTAPTDEHLAKCLLSEPTTALSEPTTAVSEPITALPYDGNEVRMIEDKSELYLSDEEAFCLLEFARDWGSSKALEAIAGGMPNCSDIDGPLICLHCSDDVGICIFCRERVVWDVDPENMAIALLVDEVVGECGAFFKEEVEYKKTDGFFSGIFCNFNFQVLPELTAFYDRNYKAAKALEAVKQILYNLPPFLRFLSKGFKFPESAQAVDPVDCMRLVLWNFEAQGIFCFGNPIMQTILVRKDGVHDLSNIISIKVYEELDEFCKVVRSVDELLVKHLKGAKFFAAPPMLLIGLIVDEVFDANPPPGYESRKLLNDHVVALKKKLVLPADLLLPGNVKPVLYEMTGYIKRSCSYLEPSKELMFEKNVAVIAYQRI